MSLAAQIADLVAPDDEPSVELARAQCPRGHVCPARESGGQSVAVAVLEDGRTYVVPDRCPHNGSRLSDGFVDGARLVCARHGWEIDLPTGQVVGMPKRQVKSRKIA